MLTFLKLGGSLITDKSEPETARPEVIRRLAEEIAQALAAQPDLQLLLGHGSGSYGHSAASRHGTRSGVATPEEWRGFAEVSVIAARLNGIVLETLHAAGIPVFRVQPSAAVVCRDGAIARFEVEPIRQAVEHGLVPLVHGDVAIDETQGGTIISTEDIFHALALELTPRRILLAGSYDGVLDEHANIIPRLTPASLPGFRQALGGSAETDVTGGMAAKVASMLELCRQIPGLSVHIFNGAEPGAVRQALAQETFNRGTRLEGD